MPKNPQEEDPDEDFEEEEEFDDEDDEFDEDEEEEFDEEEEEFDEEELKATSKAPVESKTAAAQAAPPVLEKSPPPETLALDKIPLQVAIEIGRIQMNIKNLAQLQAGNVIELNAAPEDGVDLVVQGKRIAHGELLQLGDVLGVRILGLG